MYMYVFTTLRSGEAVLNMRGKFVTVGWKDMYLWIVRDIFIFKQTWVLDSDWSIHNNKSVI